MKLLRLVSISIFIFIAINSTGITESSSSLNYDAGVKAFKGGDFFKAFEKWELLKDNKFGSPKIQNEVGRKLLEGFGEEETKFNFPEEALNWFRYAAKQGSAEAQFNLGLIAGSFNNEALYGNDMFPKMNLFYRPEKGIIEPDGNLVILQNDSESLKWFKLAAKQNHTNAQIHIGKIYLKQSKEKSLDSVLYNSAINWYKKGAKPEDTYTSWESVLARYKLGNEYENLGLYEEAIKWYKLAAVNSHQESLIKLGLYYSQENDNFEKNYTLASSLFHLAEWNGRAFKARHELDILAKISSVIEFADGKQIAKLCFKDFKICPWDSLILLTATIPKENKIARLNDDKQLQPAKPFSSTGVKIPKCPSGNLANWNNCEGSSTNAQGDTYVGVWKDGKWNGRGSYTYADGARYVGEFKDGKSHGKGTFTNAKGDKYVGEWKSNKMHGQGTFTNAKGDKYVGSWKSNKNHGQGIMTYANGNKYVGNWEHGFIHGQGIMTFSNGEKYVGQWDYGYELGQATFTQGTFTYSNGDKYIGQFLLKEGKFVGGFLQNDKKGRGTMTYANGNKYVGNWENNFKHGPGTMTYPNGEKYVGEWKDDNRHGQGTMTTAGGVSYVGGWMDDNMHGEGIITYSDGTKYEGDMKYGFMHGQGTKTFPDGRKWVGKWEKDSRKEGVYKNDQLANNLVNQDVGITSIPSEKDFLRAILPSKALRKLFKVEIISFDGFFETKTIYLAEVKATIKENKLSEWRLRSLWKDVFIENGATTSEASTLVNTMLMLDSFNDGLNLFLGGSASDTSSKNGIRTFTDTYRFGKGSKKWIYIPEKETSTSSNDTYDTNFQGWVNKYADF